MAEKCGLLHALLTCLLIVEFVGAQEVLPSRPSPPSQAPEIPVESPLHPPSQPEIPGDSPLPPPFQPEIPADSPPALPPQSGSPWAPSPAPISSSSPLAPITEVPGSSPSSFTKPEIPTPSPSPAPAPGISGSIKVSVVTVDANGEGRGEEESSDGGMSHGKEAGIAIGVIMATGVVVVGGLLYKKRRDNMKMSSHGFFDPGNFL